jgi:hypothetical protein
MQLFVCQIKLLENTMSKTSNLTIHCSGIESLGAPIFENRKKGKAAIELVDVNLSYLTHELVTHYGADNILEHIDLEIIKSYLEDRA